MPSQLLPILKPATWAAQARTHGVFLDPLFETGPRGDFYLSHDGVGEQTEDSPCIDTGTGLPSDYSMAGKTTRTDGVADSGIVDMGYHYAP